MTASGHSFDPAAWLGRRVSVQGYALAQKLGPLLSLGGPSLGVVFEDGHDWSLPLGARVRIEGQVAVRGDLPVFVRDPGAPIVQGIELPPGRELASARRRYVIEHARVVWTRPLDAVEAELAASLGRRIELPGLVWSRNGVSWFVHDGVALHLEPEAGLALPGHGEATLACGPLARRPMPRLDQLSIRAQPELADAFVLRVTGFAEHPRWELEACP